MMWFLAKKEKKKERKKKLLETIPGSRTAWAVHIIIRYAVKGLNSTEKTLTTLVVEKRVTQQ